VIPNTEADKNFLLMPWTSSAQKEASFSPSIFVHCVFG